MDKNNLLVSLDVGSSKVAVIAAEVGPDGAPRICGIGSAPSAGVKNGVLIDVGAAVGSIRAAIDEAERTSGRHIEEVYTACEDCRIRFVTSSGSTPVRGTEVTQEDCEAAGANAREAALRSGERALAVRQLEFSVDGVTGIVKPHGMAGNRLEANLLVACGAATTVTNLVRCVRRSGVEVKHWSIPVWAEACAVLTEPERDLGVCLCDIGAGTIDIAVVIRGSVRYTAEIPIGGDSITKDIAAVYRTDEKTAERIKLQFGGADPSKFSAADVVNLSELGHSDAPLGDAAVIACSELAEVIEARLRELLGLVNEALGWSKLDGQIPSGIVFTGGVSQTRGFLKLAGEVFEHRCRIGLPDGGPSIGGNGSSPAWSVAAGLIKEAVAISSRSGASGEGSKVRAGKSFFQKLRQTARHWFVGNY